MNTTATANQIVACADLSFAAATELLDALPQGTVLAPVGGPVDDVTVVVQERFGSAIFWLVPGSSQSRSSTALAYDELDWEVLKLGTVA